MNTAWAFRHFRCTRSCSFRLRLALQLEKGTQSLLALYSRFLFWWHPGWQAAAVKVLALASLMLHVHRIFTLHTKNGQAQWNHTPHVCTLRTLNGRKLNHAPYVSMLCTLLFFSGENHGHHIINLASRLQLIWSFLRGGMWWMVHQRSRALDKQLLWDWCLLFLILCALSLCCTCSFHCWLAIHLAYEVQVQPMSLGFPLSFGRGNLKWGPCQEVGKGAWMPAQGEGLSLKPLLHPLKPQSKQCVQYLHFCKGKVTLMWYTGVRTITSTEMSSLLKWMSKVFIWAHFAHRT